MNAHTPIPSGTDPSAQARREQWLDRLAQVGVEIAEAIGLQAKIAAAADPRSDDDASTARTAAALNTCALAYARAARAVRMTLALQSRLSKAPDAAPSADKAADKADDGPVVYNFSWLPPQGMDRPQHMQRVQRLVRRVAEDAALGDETCERLESEAAERLRDEDLYGDPTQRPMGAILAQICDDLGLEPDWGRLSEQAWARDEIKTGDPASPFRAWMAQPPPPDRSAESPFTGHPREGGDPGFF